MITTRVTHQTGRGEGFAADVKLSITVQGSHDVSRIVHLFAHGLVEHVVVAAELVRKLRAIPAGVAALKLLAEHGGPDYTTEYPGGHDPDEGE